MPLTVVRTCCSIRERNDTDILYEWVIHVFIVGKTLTMEILKYWRRDVCTWWDDNILCPFSSLSCACTGSWHRKVAAYMYAGLLQTRRQDEKSSRQWLATQWWHRNLDSGRQATAYRPVIYTVRGVIYTHWILIGLSGDQIHIMHTILTAFMKRL